VYLISERRFFFRYIVVLNNMVHVIFDGSEVKLENFYGENQIGGSSSSSISYFEGLPLKYQRGYGYFMGVPRQRGHGLGDVFRSIWRILKPLGTALAPMAKEAGRAIGQEGLATGARVLTDLVEGKTPVKDALTTEGREGVKRLLDRASTRLQRGSGRGGRAKKNRVSSGVMLMPGDIVSGHSIVKRSLKRGKGGGKVYNTKRQRIDSLGFY
jgi:hypothetical protein